MLRLVLALTAMILTTVATLDVAEARRGFRFSMGSKSYSRPATPTTPRSNAPSQPFGAPSTKGQAIKAGQTRSIFGGRSLPIIIPIPVSGGTSVVFVKDLPDTPEFLYEGKGFFDLGYKFGRFGGGEWVGFFKTERGYLSLNQNYVVSKVLPQVGLTAADAPQRSARSQANLLAWGVLAALVIGGFLLYHFRPSAAGRAHADDEEIPRHRRRVALEDHNDDPVSSGPARRLPPMTPAVAGGATFGKRR